MNCYISLNTFGWIPLTILCRLLSPYLTGCSRLKSTSAPGLRQFSHLQPWWDKTCSSHLYLHVSLKSQDNTHRTEHQNQERGWCVVPVDLQSMCRYRWRPGTPSATGCPPGTFSRHRSTWIRLRGRTHTSKLPRTIFLRRRAFHWTRRLTWFTLELSFAVSQTSAAHQVTVVCAAVPLLSNAMVDAVVMAPL